MSARKRPSSHKLKKLRAKDAVFVIEYLKDFGARRAAEAAGYSPDHGHVLLQREDVIGVIEEVMEARLEESGLDAIWLMYELVDNHRIARQQGNISASNAALMTLAKHVNIDALAKQKIEVDVVGENELLKRLYRGRERLNNSGDTNPSTDEEVTFL